MHGVNLFRATPLGHMLIALSWRYCSWIPVRFTFQKRLDASSKCFNVFNPLYPRNFQIWIWFILWSIWRVGRASWVSMLMLVKKCELYDHLCCLVLYRYEWFLAAALESSYPCWTSWVVGEAWSGTTMGKIIGRSSKWIVDNSHGDRKSPKDWVVGTPPTLTFSRLINGG